MDADAVYGKRMIHATQNCSAGVAGLRDLEERDIEAIVAYWHGGGADLAFLGIDIERMGGPEDTRRRYADRLRTGDKSQSSIAFAITRDRAMIGYTLLNQYEGGVGYSHWHIISPGARASGISTALYPHRIKMYFDTTGIERLVHQTRTRNIGVNRMLDRYVPVAETIFVEKPDGIAGPGEFHIRYVTRGDLPRLFAQAAELTK